jgi:hypothetical protein
VEGAEKVGKRDDWGLFIIHWALGIGHWALGSEDEEAPFDGLRVFKKRKRGTRSRKIFVLCAG